MFRTGDRARRRSTGVLELAGRLDSQVKIRACAPISPRSSGRCGGTPPVHDAAVTAVRGLDGENRLVAYVSADKAPLPAARELREFLRDVLPEPLIPTRVIALDALPLGPAGKVDLAALPPPDLTATADATQLLTTTEAIVAETWAAVLGIGQVGLDDDFFALGGYSLLVAQLAAELGRTFAIELPLAMLFDAPTVASQAARIDEARRVGSRTPALTAEPRSSRYALSFAQDRMWIVQQSQAGAPLHVLTMALRLTGALDDDRLERAMDGVAARHDGLRTTFAAEAGVPYQTIHAHRTLPRDRATIDLSDLPDDLQAAEIERIRDRDKHQPFDLAAGPPWRTRLVRLGPASHLLLVAMHHLVSDAWSMQRWLAEVDVLYGASSPGQALATLDVQPADVAAWQRRCVESGTLDRTRAYWRDRLAELGRAELPADGPRAGAEGAWSTATLAPAQADAIRALARAEGCSVFVVLLAALDLLVAELTGDDDVTIGTLVAGRHHPLVRPLIGVFLNTLPLRVNVAGAVRVRDVLPRARNATRGALAHGELPFERIVAEARQPRLRRRHPLFDVVLNYQPRGSLRRIGDLALAFLDPPAAISVPFDAMWRVIERGDSLQLRVEYRHGQFTAERVQGWLDRYLELLTSDTAVRRADPPLAPDRTARDAT